MVTKEIRKFVIKQMIEADWTNGGVNSFISKNLKINLDWVLIRYTFGFYFFMLKGLVYYLIRNQESRD